MFEFEKNYEANNLNWDVFFIGNCKELFSEAFKQLHDQTYLDKKFELSHYKTYDEAVEEIGKFNPPIIFLSCVCSAQCAAINSSIEMIEFIREVLDNKCTRIILLSDKDNIDIKEFIMKYDINDIKKPDELKGINLFTTVISSIRTYDSIMKLLNSENELIKAKAKALESSKFKSRFLAKMSHEIRTPLNGIMVTSQLLKDTTLREEQKEYVDIISKSTNRLLPIINDIIDLSKIEYGKLSISNDRMNLRDEIIDLINNAKYHAKSKGLGLYFEIDESIDVEIMGDKNRLRQVLINLINNSIKFTDKGHISVKCKLFDEKESIQYVRFEVEDTGIGIHKDEIGGIFDVFVQTETGAHIGGSGLGLSICKELVELMGGTISVDSYYGIGSRFYFELPFSKVASDEFTDGENIRIYNPKFKKSKILVADDDQLSRRVICELLQNEGMEVVTANNGYEVLDIVDDDFSMILMDITMPELDGLETTSIIRNGFNSVKTDIPIIAVSANATLDDFRRAKECGLDGYLTKPLDHTQLLDVLYKYSSV